MPRLVRGRRACPQCYDCCIAGGDGPEYSGLGWGSKGRPEFSGSPHLIRRKYMHIVYIIESVKDGSFYIGSTSNLEMRLIYHNLGYTRSTSNKRPWKVVYTEKLTNRTDSLKREIFLKKQRNRSFYKQLISGRSSDG